MDHPHLPRQTSEILMVMALIEHVQTNWATLLNHSNRQEKDIIGLVKSLTPGRVYADSLIYSIKYRDCTERGVNGIIKIIFHIS